MGCETRRHKTCAGCLFLRLRLLVQLAMESSEEGVPPEHAALVESHDRLRLLVTREQTRAEFLLGCVVAWAALQAPGIRSLVSTPVPAHLCLHLRLHTRAGPTHTHATVYTRGPEASKPVLPCTHFPGHRQVRELEGQRQENEALRACLAAMSSVLALCQVGAACSLCVR